MFTIFHFLELASVLTCLTIGVFLGHGGFGWPGLILGGAVGYFVGRILGRIPLAISLAMLRRDLKRCDASTLRSRLEREYYISHLIIAELLVRGESIESFRDYVSELLRSDSPDKRRFGERNVEIWPETAQQMSPSSPTDR